jgi:hypothetical protein
MRLSHELLAEFVTAMRQELRDGIGHERRALPRFKVWAPIRITPLVGDAPGTPYRMWVRDVSRGGVGLMYPHPMPLGDEFIITLPALVGEPQSFVCRAVYCAGSPEEMYSIGTMFVQRWDRSGAKRIPPPEPHA